MRVTFFVSVNWRGAEVMSTASGFGDQLREKVQEIEKTFEKGGRMDVWVLDVKKRGGSGGLLRSRVRCSVSQRDNGPQRSLVHRCETIERRW